MKTGPDRNDLLFLFPQQVKERLFPRLREVKLQIGQEIDAAGQDVEFVYFPVDCIISLTYVTVEGKSTEFSIVGREGVIGVSALLGARSTCSQAIAVNPGTAYRLAAADLIRECRNDGTLLLLLLRYTQALLTQIAQTAVCYRHHTLDQQLCRILLMFLDRLPNNQLFMTQELIANLLGVRREGVTEAAGKLQKLCIINYRRGHITVLDRPGLEALSCECYTVVKQESDRLSGRVECGSALPL